MKLERVLVLPIILVLLLGVFSTTCSCGSSKIASVPFIPPEYYECIEVDPQDLVDVYFMGYGDFTRIEAQYNDKIYVFKNREVDEPMLEGLSEGFIWIYYIKCYLVDPSSMEQFELGDKIDVVGWNRGPTSYTVAGLKFDGCLAIPAGTVALPAEAGSGPVVPGY